MASFPINSPSNLSKTSLPLTSFISVFGVKLGEIEHTHLRLRSRSAFRLKASVEPFRLTKELSNNKLGNIEVTENDPHTFIELKQRFLSFKKQKYLANIEYYQCLANAQAPKFMMIACADSRVCPSHVLGIQPGESFTVRNVGNLVPPFENGPTETNAGLEFAVNTLEVQNILVFGHSCCGGIRALMSMQDEEDSSSFIKKWVVVGKKARLSTKAAVSNLSLEQQCKHCEKESVNRSLINLLTYPWIEERVNKGLLSIHGGYYDFVNCTFEKWALDYKENISIEKSEMHAIKNREFWC